MDLSHVFDLGRWRRRFIGDEEAAGEQREGGAPDATAEEVGTPPDNQGFNGRPLSSGPSSGSGSGDPSSPGWAGWGSGGT